MVESNRTDQRVAVLLKEYESLRAEVHVSMDNRNQVLSFSLAAIAIVIGGAFSLEHKTTSPMVWAFGVSVPLLALFALALWLIEYLRMIRAGRHLRTVERRVDQLLESDVPLMSWERSLAELDGKQRWVRYDIDFGPAFVVLAFVAVVIASPFAAVSLSSSAIMIAVAISAGWLIVLVVTIAWFTRMYNNITKRHDEADDPSRG